MTVETFLLEPAVFESVKPFASRAAKEHVAIAPTGRTEWFVVRESGAIVGIAALIKIGLGYRLKGFWVEPTCRGRGIGGFMLRELIEMCEFRCASYIEAFALHPRIYYSLGFRTDGTLRDKVTKVIKVL